MNNFSLDDLAKIVCKNTGIELVVLQSIITISIARNLSSYEQNLFGNFLMSIGQNLSLIAVKKSQCESNVKNYYNNSNTNQSDGL